MSKKCFNDFKMSLIKNSFGHSDIDREKCLTSFK